MNNCDSFQDGPPKVFLSSRQKQMIFKCRKIHKQLGYSAFNFYCGRHSGFPLCCVLFMIIVRPILSEAMSDQYDQMQDYFEKKRSIFNRIYVPFLNDILPAPGFGRLACPFCLLSSRKTGWINCGCGR